MKIQEIKKIVDKLNFCYNYVKEKNYDVLGAFLFGSQNYNLSDELSDIDVKVIVVPTLRDIIEKRNPTSTTLVLEDNSHIDLKDIRVMFECYLKQNVNFLETLFTPFFIINPKYQEEWDRISYNESIPYYDIYRGVQAIFGDMKNKYKSLYKLSPHTQSDIEKYGYSLKDFHHIKRLEDFLPRYIKDEEKYADILIPKNLEEIRSYKRKALPLNQVEILSKTAMEKTQELVNSLNSESFLKNEKALELLKDVQYNIIKNKILTDIGGN